MQDAYYEKSKSMNFYAWQSDLKTVMYYLRTKSAVDAIKFTLNNDKKAEPIAKSEMIIDVPVVAAVAPVAVAAPMEVNAIAADEFQAMIARSRSSEPDDCEMCGS